MPKIHEVLSGARETTVEFAGGITLTVEYDPNEYTADAESVWRAAEKEGWAGPVAVDFICRLVTSWDLEENDSEEIVELTQERVSKVSMMLLGRIMDAINLDVGDAGKGGNRATRRQAKRLSSVDT